MIRVDLKLLVNISIEKLENHNLMVDKLTFVIIIL